MLLLKEIKPEWLQTHLGRVCPRHIRILDPKRKIEPRAASSSSSWQVLAGGTNAWRQQWCSSSSGWDRSQQWSAPTSPNLTGPNHDLDHEWRQGRMCHATGWAHNPSWSQSKRVKPTHTDPEDDRHSDPPLTSGSTSKMWDPARDHGFWSEGCSTHGLAASASSSSSTHWRPKLRADKDISSNAGDTSESSTTGPRLGCIDELSSLDEEALRTIQERVNQGLERKGGSR